MPFRPIRRVVYPKKSLISPHFDSSMASFQGPDDHRHVAGDHGRHGAVEVAEASQGAADVQRGRGGRRAVHGPHGEGGEPVLAAKLP